MAIKTIGCKPRDLRSPGDGIDAVLSFGRLRQDIKCRQRIGVKLEGLMRLGFGAAVITLLKKSVGLFQQLCLAPVGVKPRAVGEADNSDDEANGNAGDEKGQSLRRNI